MPQVNTRQRKTHYLTPQKRSDLIKEDVNLKVSSRSFKINPRSRKTENDLAIMKRPGISLLNFNQVSFNKMNKK